MKPIVRLYDLFGLALIVEHETGIIYSNQTGGTFCNQPELEGFALPIGTDVSLDGRVLGPAPDLEEYFEGPPHRGSGAIHGITSAEADMIDTILNQHRLSCLKVDRSKMRDSHEAWIWVRIEKPDELQLSGIKANTSAVLTWQNSD